MIALQRALYCLLFTAMARLCVLGGAVNGLYFYPKSFQERAAALGRVAGGLAALIFQ